MQHYETLMIVGEAVNTYYRGPGKSENKNESNTLSFPETKPLSCQKSEVPACVHLCDVIEVCVQVSFPLGEGSL